MNALKANYFDAYRSLKLTRGATGLLVPEFHSKVGPFIFTAQDHTELVDAFYRIAQDRANKIVILTGAAARLRSLDPAGNVRERGTKPALTSRKLRC